MDSLLQLGNYLVSAFAIMAILTVLVYVHELGHYWFARVFGMHVDAFAVMMGGIRATDLSSRLKRPLAPGHLVALVGSAAAAAAFFGGKNGVAWLYVVGLVVLGLVVPVWIATRIGALYQMSLGEAMRPIALSWVVLGGLTAVTSRGDVTVSQALSVLALASTVGLLILYYHPMARKPEDAPMGEGSLVLDGQPEPVRFRPLWSRRNREGTEFSLLALPLGGFAAIRGMHPKPDGSEVQIEGGFYSKPAWQRFVVLFAGPLFSVAFGVTLLTATFATFGVEQPLNRPVLGAIAPGSAAEKAGIRAGDVVRSIDGQPVATYFDIIRVVRANAGNELRFEIDRGGKRLQATVVPIADVAPTPVIDEKLQLTDERKVQGKFGAIWKTERVSLPLGEAVVRAAVQPVEMVAGLGRLAAEPSRAKDEVGSVGSIAAATSVAVNTGFDKVLWIAAMLSISLGIMNLLPVPPLDGGQMVVALVEMFRRRRLSIRVQHTVSTVGFVLICALVLGLLASDINRFTGR